MLWPGVQSVSSVLSFASGAAQRGAAHIAFESPGFLRDFEVGDRPKQLFEFHAGQQRAAADHSANQCMNTPFSAVQRRVTSLHLWQRSAAQRSVQCSAALRSAVQRSAAQCSACVLGRSVCNQSTALGTALHAGTVETLVLAAGLGFGSIASYGFISIGNTEQARPR